MAHNLENSLFLQPSLVCWRHCSEEPDRISVWNLSRNN